MARHSKDRVSQWYENNVHLETRTLYIGDEDEGGEVGPSMAVNVLKAFHLFDTQSADRPVTVMLNTQGGCWYNGMAIYDAIEQSVCHVDVYAIGSVMSMGSIILQAADVRYMYPHATLMIHDGSEDLHGHARNVINWAKHSEKLLGDMYRIYSKRSGRPPSFWKKRCGHDTILSAGECLELGLIDHIVGEE